MSFDVFFIALEPPKPAAVLHEQVEGTVASAGGPLRQRSVKGSRELPLHERTPDLVVIDRPEELDTLLRGGYAAWTECRDRVVKNCRQA